MNTAAAGVHPLRDRLKTASRKLQWLGIAMVILGVLALAFPELSTLALTLFVGFALFAYGAINLGVSISLIAARGSFLASLISALVSVAAGLFLLTHPLMAAATLTLMASVLFLISAVHETIIALEVRPAKGWGYMLLSAAASALVAIFIFTGWPAVSLIVLGTLFGVKFIFSGVGLISVSRAVKHLT